MTNNIEHIITKFWAGESNLDEENQLRSYLASGKIDASHKDYTALFQYFNLEKSRGYKGELTLDSLQNKVKARASELLQKYFEGETTLADEESLKFYFSSEDISDEHKEYAPLFQFFIEQEHITDAKAIDTSFTAGPKTRTLAPKVQKTETKTRRLLPRVAVVAASLALLMTFTFGYFQGVSEQEMAEAEAKEALETTMEALAYLGHNYDKGTNPMKHMKQLEKTNIFNFNLSKN